MEVIFAGALSRTLGMPDALRAVLGVPNLPFGILRVTSSDTSVNGKLIVAESRFIVGAASADGSESSYAAARRLLTVSDGTFAYLNAGAKAPPEFDDSLCLSIDKVLLSLPELPETAAVLFDEKSLLDKVFGGGAGGPGGSLPSDFESSAQSSPMPTIDFPSHPLTISASNGNAKSAWRFMQPLLNSPGGNAPTSEPTFDFEDTSPEKISLNKLRAQRSLASQPWYKELFREALWSKQTLIWLSIVIFVITVLIVGTQIVGHSPSPKAHNSLTIQ